MTDCFFIVSMFGCVDGTLEGYGEVARWRGKVLLMYNQDNSS